MSLRGSYPAAMQHELLMAFVRQWVSGAWVTNSSGSLVVAALWPGGACGVDAGCGAGMPLIDIKKKGFIKKITSFLETEISTFKH